MHLCYGKKGKSNIMRKLICLGILALVVTAIAGCKTVSESEHKQQMRMVDKATNGSTMPNK